MRKSQFKSQASSGRAGASFGAFGSSTFGSAGQTSVLSYVQEPPNHSTIANTNVVVALKSLSKKDETTKAKALEDLQSTIASLDAEVEEGLLEAWACDV
jgi:E3 ubiquitin-protein ligase listerin